jgi:hypothetical protein
LVSCGPHTVPLVDPALASCVPPGTVYLAGLDLELLRASSLYSKLPAIDAVANASYVLVTSDGSSIVWIARGKFPKAPAGATLIAPGVVISGPAAAVSRAMTQHQRGTSGAPDLLSHASAAPLWAVVRGGIKLPLSGNLENVNRLLRLVDYLTLDVHLDAGVHLHLAGIAPDTEKARDFEETLRAVISLAEAAGPRIAPTLGAIVLRRQDSVVNLTLDTTADAIEALMGAATLPTPPVTGGTPPPRN